MLHTGLCYNTCYCCHLLPEKRNFYPDGPGPGDSVWGGCLPSASHRRGWLTWGPTAAAWLPQVLLFLRPIKWPGQWLGSQAEQGTRGATCLKLGTCQLGYELREQIPASEGVAYTWGFLWDVKEKLNYFVLSSSPLMSISSIVQHRVTKII